MGIKINYPEATPSPQPDYLEILTLLVSVFGMAMIGVFFGIKTYDVYYKKLPYLKWLVILLYITSWGFIFTQMIILFKNNGSSDTCNAEIFVCVFFYSFAKVITYAWLLERVWIVQPDRTTRWKSKIYRFFIILFTMYIGICFLMIYYRGYFMVASGRCYVTLAFATGVAMLIYDFLANFTLTMLFMRPLIKISRNKIIIRKTSELQKLAYRSLVATTIAFIASFTNILLYFIFDHVERGVVCLLSCNLDIMLNVIGIHWVTTPRKTPSTTGPYESKNIKTLPIATVNFTSSTDNTISFPTSASSCSSNSPLYIKNNNNDCHQLLQYNQKVHDNGKSKLYVIDDDDDDDHSYNNNHFYSAMPYTSIASCSQKISMTIPPSSHTVSSCSSISPETSSSTQNNIFNHFSLK